LLPIQYAWRRLPTALRVVLPPFLVVRIGLALFALVSLHLFPLERIAREQHRDTLLSLGPEAMYAWH